MAPLEIKNLKGLENFRNKIINSDYKLCKDFVTAGCEIGTGLAMVATE